MALRDEQNTPPTRVKISPRRRDAQKPGSGENTSLHYGDTILVTNSRQQQATSSYSITERLRCYEYKKIRLATATNQTDKKLNILRGLRGNCTVKNLKSEVI
jgi:hypothetical protein